MASHDQPGDPQEVLEAAEAAHLAARRAVPVPVSGPVPRGGPGGRAGPEPARRRERTGREVPPGLAVAPGGPAPGRRRPGGTTRAPLPVAAVVAAGWAALVSFAPVAVVVTLLRLADGGTPVVAGPVRVAAAGWLLAHGVPLQTTAGPVGLVPLGLGLLAAWRVARAGVHVTRATRSRGSGSPRHALVAAVAVAVPYGLVGVLVAAVAGGPAWQAQVPRAGLTLAGFGLVAAATGAVWATGAGRGWRIPPVLRHGVRSGVVAAALVLAAGAAAAGVAVAASGATAADLFAAYGTGVAGQAGLTLLCLAYAPNLSGWATAYLIGPGFAIGTGTVVSSSEVVLGPVPAVPVFAGLPGGPLPTAGAVLLVVPLVAGALAGWRVARRVPGWGRILTGGVVTGTVAAGLLGLAVLASGGPLGDGDLAALGPAPVPVVALSMPALTASALLGGAAAAVVRRSGLSGLPGTATRIRGSRPSLVSGSAR